MPTPVHWAPASQAHPVIPDFKTSHSDPRPEGCQGSPALLTCRATDGPCTRLWSGWGSVPAQQCRTSSAVRFNWAPALCSPRSWAPYTGTFVIETCTHTFMTMRFFCTALEEKEFFKFSLKRKNSLNSSKTKSTSNEVLLCTARKKTKQTEIQTKREIPTDTHITSTLNPTPPSALSNFSHLFSKSWEGFF